VVGASTFAAIDVAGGALPVTSVVAAEAVNAESGETGVRTAACGPVGHLGRAGARVITVGIGAALSAAGARFTAVSSCAVALVRAARFGARVEADSKSGTLIWNIESEVGADLVGALGSGDPIATLAGAVTETVVAARACCLLDAVVGRVSTLCRWRARTRTVANLTFKAAILRVGVVGVEGAGTLQTFKGTTFAEPVTGRVAAVAIDTEAGATLVVAHARLALVTLGLALVLLAVVAIAAVIVATAKRATALAIAHVGAAVGCISAAADVAHCQTAVTAVLREVAEVGSFASAGVVLSFTALADRPDSGIAIAAASSGCFIIDKFTPGTESTTHGLAVELRLSEGHEATAVHVDGVRLTADKW